MVIPFSKGHILHAHAEPFGRLLVYLSMGLLVVAVWCTGLLWGAWTCLRDLKERAEIEDMKSTIGDRRDVSSQLFAPNSPTAEGGAQTIQSTNFNLSLDKIVTHAALFSLECGGGPRKARSFVRCPHRPSRSPQAQFQTPRTPSICSSFVFMVLRVAFTATLLFSRISALPYVFSIRTLFLSPLVYPDLRGGRSPSPLFLANPLIDILLRTLWVHQKNSTSLQSSKSRLFAQNTRGGV
jgi:hypothetical protein